MKRSLAVNLNYSSVRRSAVMPNGVHMLERRVVVAPEHIVPEVYASNQQPRVNYVLEGRGDDMWGRLAFFETQYQFYRSD
jgi:hypothetical protein